MLASLLALAALIPRTRRSLCSGINANILLHRQAATSNVSADAGTEILAKQRLQRPVAPHLSIYKWQMTWIPSALNRVTGVMLSGIFYLYSIGYLVAPALGLHLESAVVAASFAAWPLAAKVLVKTTLALPFTFHSINGLRHLTWDFGKAINNQTVKSTGLAASIAAVLSALYLGVAY
jgi:succinate dehydrogenase (ubiquinone) cytochrome b560 subunit